MRIVNSGALSIVSLDDFKQLTMYIGSSESKTIIYDPDNNTYSPNYSISNQILSPQLYIAGSNSNVISNAVNIKWYRQNDSSGELIRIVSGNDNHVINNRGELVISSENLGGYSSITYVCDIEYKDPESGIEIPIKSDFQITKVNNGAKGEDGEPNIFMNILTPDGNVIKNSEGELVLKSESYIGSEVIEPDYINWYKMGKDYFTYIETGKGWANITDSIFKDEITIKPDDIDGMTSIMCVSKYYEDRNEIPSLGYTLDSSGSSMAVAGDVSIDELKINKLTISIFDNLSNYSIQAIYSDSTIESISNISSTHTTITAPNGEYIMGVYANFKNYDKHTQRLEDFVRFYKGDAPEKYGDVIYRKDIVTLMDLTDPYTVVINGQSTFKNGQGQSSFLARVYQNGEEIDLTGEKFNYSWSLYKEDGTALISFGNRVGKSVTVNSSDFIERANLICEISEK